MPGSPTILAGRPISLSRGNDAVIDQNLSRELGLNLGDNFTIRTIQGTDEKFYKLTVTGITSNQEYLFRSSIFVPYLTWDQIRPQPSIRDSNQDLVTNIVAIKLLPGSDPAEVGQRIQSQVDNLEVVDLKAAYEAVPGYKVQQSTLNTQQGFTLLIGVLVIGGFFQIQMLQKVPLIGVLKAIGTSNSTVAWAVVTQIVIVTTIGVLFGSLVTLGLAAAMPAGVPIVFNGPTIIIAIISLLMIGPLGGLVSVKLAVNVEPLTALGLTLKDDLMDTVLQANSITKIYRSGSNETTAVDDISLTVGRGEFVAIVGPSGSGKTTLLAVLAALLRPTNGEVYIDNVDLKNMNDRQRVMFRREKIGFTFQANNLLPFLTVQENVEMMLRLNGTYTRETKILARDLLCRLGLEDRLTYLPSQLSGGQRQRVSIARALVHNPSLVLADEPTASLDTDRAYQVVKIFSDLIHEQNKAGIIVTHDLRMCIYVDKVIQMMDGKVENILSTRQEIDDFMACG